MKLSDLKQNEVNPRSISDRSRDGLHTSMEEFGDISGIVYNRSTERLVGGHQRQSVLLDMFGEDPDIEVVKEFGKPTKDGTVAIGVLKTSGGQVFSVRMVEWDEKKEAAANLSANNTEITGYFDMDKLGDFISLASEYEAFDGLLLDDLAFNFDVPDPISEQVMQQAETLNGWPTEEAISDSMVRGLQIAIRDGIFPEVKEQYLRLVKEVPDFDLIFADFIKNEHDKLG